MASISSIRNTNTSAAADTRGRPADGRQLHEDGDALNRRKNEEFSASQKAQFMMGDISARAGQAVAGAADRLSSAAKVAGQAATEVAHDVTGKHNSNSLSDVDLGSRPLKQEPSLHRQEEMMSHEGGQAKNLARTEVLPNRRLSTERSDIQKQSLTTDDKPVKLSAQIQRPAAIPQAPILSPTWRTHNLEHGCDTSTCASQGSAKIPAAAFDAGMAQSMGNIGEKAAKDVQKAWNATSEATARAAHVVSEKAHDAAHVVSEKAQAAGHTVKEFLVDAATGLKEDTILVADKTAELSKKAWVATSTTAANAGHVIAEDSKILAHKAEEVAHKVDDAAHSAKEATENVAHKMAHAVRDGAKKAGEAIVHAYDKTAAAVRHAFEKTSEAGAHVAESTVDGLAYTASAGAALGKQTVAAAEHATDVVVDKTRSALAATANAASYAGNAVVETAKDAAHETRAAVHSLATKVADKTDDKCCRKEAPLPAKQDDLSSLEKKNLAALNSSLARTCTDINIPTVAISPLADHAGVTVSDYSTLGDKEREQELSHHKDETSFGAQRPL
jgi:hypothetical protein